MRTNIEKVSDLIRLLQDESASEFELPEGKYHVYRVLTDNNPAGDLALRAINVSPVKGSVYDTGNYLPGGTYSVGIVREISVMVGTERIETYGIIDEKRLKNYSPHDGENEDFIRIPVRGGSINISKAQE